MEQTTPPASSSALQPLYRRILAYPPLDWMLLGLELARSLWLFIRNNPKQTKTKASPKGPYTILNLQATLELKDPDGHEAILTKLLHLHFLQDTRTYEDHIWGDGQLADYTCSPGTPVSLEKDGDRCNVVISFQKPIKAGAKPYLRMAGVIIDGFTQNSEAFQAELRHPADRLQLEVIFNSIML